MPDLIFINIDPFKDRCLDLYATKNDTTENGPIAKAHRPILKLARQMLEANVDNVESEPDTSDEEGQGE